MRLGVLALVALMALCVGCGPGTGSRSPGPNSTLAELGTRTLRDLGVIDAAQSLGPAFTENQPCDDNPSYSYTQYGVEFQAPAGDQKAVVTKAAEIWRSLGYEVTTTPETPPSAAFIHPAGFRLSIGAAHDTVVHLTGSTDCPAG